ncbi:MAG: glycosyltransferase family 2 protein [Candidatus Binatia bacterium]
MYFAEAIFWLSAAGLFYTFIGYPLMMAIMAWARPRSMLKKAVTPKVSLVVTAHNEEVVIREKIENGLALDYPRERLEIIVASDCSTDRTNQIVSEYASKGVRLAVLDERKGKTAAQNLAVSKADGEIIVFSDASTLLHPDAIRKMAQNFGDPTIGCVSGEDKSINSRDGRRIEDEGLYVRYEMLIRRWESRVGSIVGASGCLYGVRRSLWRQPEEFLVVDFTTPLDVREQGFRILAEPEAVAYVKTVASSGEEFARRVRTASRGQLGLLYKRQLLNPFRFGFFSIQLFSHKLLRFCAPILLILLLIANGSLVSESVIYAVSMALQGAFYATAWIGFLLKDRPNRIRVFSLPFYFVMVNWAILVAWTRVFLGKTDAMWIPSRRVPA